MIRYGSAMNDAIAFDTHRSVKRLMEGGFEERQAEVRAEEQMAFLNANLTTKLDIAEVKADIEALRRSTEAKIETDIAKVNNSLVRWMFGALFAYTTILVALFGFFAGLQAS